MLTITAMVPWEPPETNTELYLRLMPDGRDAVVRVVDGCGNKSSSVVLRIKPDGLVRPGGIEHSLGIPLDAKGRIKLLNEDDGS